MASSTRVFTSENDNKVLQNENRNGWVWGFTPQAELWNGRLAMIGFMAAFVVELLFGKGVLHV